MLDRHVCLLRGAEIALNGSAPAAAIDRAQRATC